MNYEKPKISTFAVSAVFITMALVYIADSTAKRSFLNSSGSELVDNNQPSTSILIHRDEALQFIIP